MERTTWTASQVVAHNLKRLRERAEWGQAEFGEKLEPYLGEHWSVSSVSNAEISSDPKRRRKAFDAGEIVALALLFDIHISALFEPPLADGVFTSPSATLEPSGVPLVEALRRVAGLNAADFDKDTPLSALANSVQLEHNAVAERLRQARNNAVTAEAAASEVDRLGALAARAIRELAIRFEERGS